MGTPPTRGCEYIRDLKLGGYHEYTCMHICSRFRSRPQVALHQLTLHGNMSILLVELPGFVCSARTPVERLFCRQQKLTSFLQGLPFLRQSIGGGPGRLFRAARLPLLQPQLMQKTRGALTGAACRSPLCRRTWLDSGGVRFGDRNGGACIKFTARCLESAQCRRKPGAMRRQTSPTTAKKNKRTSGEVLRFAAPPSAYI